MSDGEVTTTLGDPRYVNSEGGDRVYWINWTTMTTTWDDPRGPAFLGVQKYFSHEYYPWNRKLWFIRHQQLVQLRRLRNQ